MKFSKRKHFILSLCMSLIYQPGIKVTVERNTGKFTRHGKEFYCYASKAERFPAVRENRWKNFDDVKAGEQIILPNGATHVRIHGSGDFFSQDYFDSWLSVCDQNPGAIFWAFMRIMIGG